MIPERDSGRIPPSNAPRRTGTVPPVLRDTARKAEAGTSADARAMSDKDIIIMQDCILIPPQFTAAFLRGKRLFLDLKFPVNFILMKLRIGALAPRRRAREDVQEATAPRCLLPRARTRM
jgi:hypothetical protein